MKTRRLSRAEPPLQWAIWGPGEEPAAFWHSAARAGIEIRSREQGGTTPAHLGWRKVENPCSRRGPGCAQPRGFWEAGGGGIRELSDLGTSLGMGRGRQTFLSTWGH